MLYVLVDILSIFKFKFLTKLIILVNQLMILLQCAEFNEQIKISFVQLDVFEVFIASLCRFSKYTGCQDWKKWGKKQDWIKDLAKFIQVHINVCTHHIQ